MAIAYNTSIIRNGLVLYLDAANSKSYPGSGTTWTDLSRNNNNGTLINGTTFSSLYLGGLINDNLDDYIDTNYTTGVNNFTITIWAQRTSESFWSVIWANEVWNNETGYVAYLTSSNQLVFSRGGGSTPITSIITNSNLPSFYIFSVNSSNNATVYQNASLVGSGAIAAPGSITKTIKLNTRHSNDGNSFADRRFGNIYSFNYYNRVLSQVEIQQNFNATRSRYGI